MSRLSGRLYAGTIGTLGVRSEPDRGGRRIREEQIRITSPIPNQRVHACRPVVTCRHA